MRRRDWRLSDDGALHVLLFRITLTDELVHDAEEVAERALSCAVLIDLSRYPLQFHRRRIETERTYRYPHV